MSIQVGLGDVCVSFIVGEFGTLERCRDQKRQRYDTAEHKEVRPDCPATPCVKRALAIPSYSLLLLPPMCSIMSFVVKMRNIIIPANISPTESRAAYIPFIYITRLKPSAGWRRTGRICVCGSFCCLGTPSTASIETWWWSSKVRSSPT